MKSMVGSFAPPKVLNEYCPIHTDTKLIQGSIPGHQEKVCKKCVEEQSNERVLKAEENFNERKTIERLYKDSVITDEEVREKTFDNFQVTNHEQNNALNQMKYMANQYLDKDFKGNTVLVGKAGTGKTHLAYASLEYVNSNANPKQSCLFVDFNELLMRIKSNFKNDATIWKEQTMLDQIGSADLVVLDDIGSEASFKADNNESSEWNQRFLFNILNRRNRTIITTNLVGAEMKEVYNPKIISRINKGIKKHFIKFGDNLKDQRKDLY